MDFTWVVDALRRGRKVRRRAWLLTNPTMYLKIVKDAELKRKVVRVFCGGREAATWWPTQEELFDFIDWEEYVEPQKEPDYTTELPFVMTEQNSHGWKPLEEQELDEDTKQAIEQLAKITAEGFAAIFREDSIRRIIQKTCMKPDKDIAEQKKAQAARD